LPSESWTFGNISEVNGTLSFSITSCGERKGRYSLLQFNNHINNNTNSSNFKFDVTIKDYIWVSTDSNASLALSYTYHQPNSIVYTWNYHNDGNTEQVDIGNLYFSIYKTAQADGVNDVASSLGEDSDGSITVYYEHFNSSLHHDPTIGLTNSAFTFTIYSALIFLCVFIYIS